MQPNHPFALIGERVLMPCPAGLVVPAVVGGQPIGAAVVHLYVRNGAAPLACPVCEGKGMIFADPRRLATPNIGYTEEESKEPAPSRPRLVTPN